MRREAARAGCEQGWRERLAAYAGDTEGYLRYARQALELARRETMSDEPKLPSADELLQNLTSRALKNGGRVNLPGGAKKELELLAHGMVGTAAGDERAAAHLKADLLSDAFYAEATAFLLAKAWQDALIETLAELAAMAIEVGAKAALNGLAEGLKQRG